MRSSACAWPRRRRPRASTPFCTTKKAITYSRMERREFVQFCIAAAATAGSPAVAADAEPRRDLRTQAHLPDTRDQLYQLSPGEDAGEPLLLGDPLLLGAQPVRPGCRRARGRRTGAA